MIIKKKNRHLNLILPIIIGLLLGFFLLLLPLFRDYLTDIHFSHPSGNYHQPFTLTVYQHKFFYPQKKVFYTTDGSIPDRNSPVAPHKIEIDQNMILRFRIISQENTKEEIFNRSYILTDHKRLPVVSLITDPKNLWDKEVGIYTEGSDPDDPNYNEDGNDWEKPVDVNFIESNGKLAFSLEAEIEIHGGGSKVNPQKSLRICTNPKKYRDEILNYQLFPDEERKQFKCFLLRSGGSDWNDSLMRDVIAQKFAKDLNLDHQSSRPAVVYINGQYWGIHYIRDFLNLDHLGFKYKTDPDDFTILEPPNEVNNFYRSRLHHGEEDSKEKYDEFLKDIDLYYPNSSKSFDKITQIIDVDNLIKYISLESILANIDWPSGNNRLYRFNRKDNFPEKSQYDGRFRWLVFDMDTSLGRAQKNRLFDAIQDHGQEAPPLLRDDQLIKQTAYVAASYNIFDRLEKKHDSNYLKGLFKNDIYREKFLSTYFDILNNIINSENLIREIDYQANLIKDEMPRHIARWKDTESTNLGIPLQNYDHWLTNVEYMKTFAKIRSKYAEKQIYQFLELKQYHELEVKKTSPAHSATIAVNGHKIPSYHLPWEIGFEEDQEINIEFAPQPGYKFDYLLVNNEKMTDLDLNFHIKKETEIKLFLKKKNDQ